MVFLGGSKHEWVAPPLPKPAGFPWLKTLVWLAAIGAVISFMVRFAPK